MRKVAFTISVIMTIFTAKAMAISCADSLAGMDKKKPSLEYVADTYFGYPAWNHVIFLDGNQFNPIRYTYVTKENYLRAKYAYDHPIFNLAPALLIRQLNENFLSYVNGDIPDAIFRAREIKIIQDPLTIKALPALFRKQKRLPYAEELDPNSVPWRFHKDWLKTEAGAKFLAKELP